MNIGFGRDFYLLEFGLFREAILRRFVEEGVNLGNVSKPKDGYA